MAYNVSSDFRNKLYSGESQFRATLTIGEQVIDNSQIASISISSPIVDDSKQVFYVGSFISQKITIHFKNMDGIDVISGENVDLSIGQYVNNEWVDVPIGKFLIDDLAEDYYDKCEIDCYDYGVLFKPNIDYSPCFVDGKATIKTILEYICQQFSVELGDYPTVNDDVEIGTYDSTISGKQWISYIAEIKGCNAKIDRLGRLTLQPLKQPSSIPINALESESFETGEDYKITQVIFFDAVRNYTIGDVDGNTLYIRQDNPFINDINVVKNIYDTICTTKYSASGTSFDLDDVDAHNMILNTIYGETSQDTYSGKNLINIYNYTINNTNYGSFTILEDDYVRFVNNTGNGFTVSFAKIKVTGGEKYTFSMDFKNYGSRQIVWILKQYDSNNTVLQQSYIGTSTLSTQTMLSSTTTLEIILTTQNTSTRDDFTVRIQVESGSTATDYEQYVGGTPSPNPDYPQEIHNVSGDNSIKNTGKNLANIYLGGLNKGDSRVVNGITFTINQDGTISGHGTATAQSNFILFGGWSSLDNGYIQIDKNEYYSLSNNGSRDESGDTGRFYTRLARYNNGTISYTSVGDNTYFSGWEYVCLIMLTVASGQTVDFDNKWYQLEKGKIITPFEEYQEKQYKISLPVENKFDIGSSSGTSMMISKTYNHSEITLNGTCSGNGYLIDNNSVVATLPKGTYTIQINVVDGTVSTSNEAFLIKKIVSGTATALASYSLYQTTNIKYTINLDETSDIAIAYWVNSGVIFNNCKIQCQLEEGTKANTYVPYGLVPIGENLFDKDNVDWYRNNNTSWSNTTDNNTTRIRTSSFELKGGKTYTIGGIPNGISFIGAGQFEVPSGSSTGGATVSGNTFTLSANTKYVFLLFGGSNFDSSTNVLMKNADIRIEEGSISHANDHAIELNKISDISNSKDEIFRNGGKNLLDLDSLTFRNGYYSSTGQFVSANNNGTLEFTNVKPNTTYTFSINTQTTNAGGITITEFNNSSFVIRTSNSASKSFTFTTSNTTNNIAIGINYNGSTTITKDLIASWQPMLELGNQPSTYEPYGNGDWYWRRNIKKTIYTGADNWQSHEWGTNSYQLIQAQIISYQTKPVILSNLFRGVAFDDRTTTGNNIIYQDNYNSIIVRNTTYTSLSDFKSMLNSNNLITYYILKLTEYAKITYQPLIDQLNAIENDSLLEGTNHITIEPNDLTPTIDIDYFKNSNFTLTSLKTHNYGDFTLDAWDNIDYDLDGTHYLTLNNNEITYEMSIMSDVDTKIPTKQQEVTTNIVSGDDKTNIKKIKTRVDNLDASVEILSQQQTTTETNLSQLQIDVNGIEQNVEHIENVEINGENGIVSQIASVRTSVNNITNMFQITGGINVIRNSAFLLSDEVWEFTDNGSNPYHTELGNSYNSTLSGSTVSVAEIKLRSIKVKSKSENVTNLLVGTNYTFNFYHKQDNNMTTTIKMYSTENNSSKAFDDIVITGQQPMKSYSVSFTPSYTNYTIEIIVTSSANVGYAYLYDMMLNSGDIQSWQPASDEIYSTTLTMSRLGLKVYSSGDGTITLLGSDGMLTYETTDGKTLGRLVSSRTVDGDRTRNVVTQSIYLTRDITQENLNRWVETIINVSNRPYKVEYVESGE